MTNTDWLLLVNLLSELLGGSLQGWSALPF